MKNVIIAGLLLGISTGFFMPSCNHKAMKNQPEAKASSSDKSVPAQVVATQQPVVVTQPQVVVARPVVRTAPRVVVRPLVEVVDPYAYPYPYWGPDYYYVAPYVYPTYTIGVGINAPLYMGGVVYSRPWVYSRPGPVVYSRWAPSHHGGYGHRR